MYTFFSRQLSSFTFLNITQFLGALNDNIFKLLIVFFLIQTLGPENKYVILSTTGAIFVLPFLLFSSNSGTMADRFSKRNIIVLTKILELLVMSFGLLAFAFESVTGSYITLFLMATQSAIFGPSKYGIIPEIVTTERISTANGLMTSFTFLAIIVGTFLASFLTDITDRNFILAALFCTIVSLAGVITSFGIEYTPPSGSLTKFDIRFIRQIIDSLKIARQYPSLLAAMVGSAFFLFLGAFMQLNIIPFAMESLGLTDVGGGYLFLIIALGIGTGSMMAGKISGRTVELGLVPVAAAGITVCLFFLDFFSSSLSIVAPLVIVTGILGGLYQIPLDSYVQVSSPHESRGQIVAATNFFSFFGVLLASGMLILLSEVFHLDADKSFTVMGFMTMGITVFFGFRFFDYMTRFIGMLISKLHFSTICQGEENIPGKQAIYVCYHTAWNDTLLFLESQRRRIRFFIENEKNHKPWVIRLYKFLKVVLVPPIEPLENNKECMIAIEKSLRKEISICIFVDNENIQEEIEKLKRSVMLSQIIQETRTPIIPVYIEKGEKASSAKLFTRLRNKLHVPAEITFEKPV